MLGKIMSRFKTKPKVTVHKNITKPTVTIQKKLPTKTKNGHNRKEVSHTTIFQVRKAFAIHKENPSLSARNIGAIVNMSGELVRYYLGLGKTKAISTFKKREQKHKTLEKKSEKKAIKILKLTEKKADQNIKTLFKTEKYPVEHQSDPKYFGGTEPPQSVATEEGFHKQKLKNNALRAISAKQIEQDKQDKATLIRIGARHRNPKTKPKIHYDDCPSCNPNSKLTNVEYQYRVTKEALRRHEYAQTKMAEKELQLNNKEKELDQRERSQQPTVAERTQQGTKLCRTCDSNIPYSQASRSFSIYKEYYCRDHEPKLN